MVLNLARTLPMTQAVAAGDRALALGLTRQQLGAGLSAMEHWPGVRARAGWAGSSMCARRALVSR